MDQIEGHPKEPLAAAGAAEIRRPREVSAEGATDLTSSMVYAEAATESSTWSLGARRSGRIELAEWTTDYQGRTQSWHDSARPQWFVPCRCALSAGNFTVPMSSDPVGE
eukprot:2408726-Prymnesium_polylepis.1